MSKIIKLEDLKILCIPFKITKSKTELITRIDLVKSRIHFVNSAKQLQFRHMNFPGGAVPGSGIRFFEHDEFPKTKFYFQTKTTPEIEKMCTLDQKQFFSLSETKKDSCCTSRPLLSALNINPDLNTSSFDSEKITKVLSDDGWIFEVDITNYIESMLAL